LRREKEKNGNSWRNSSYGGQDNGACLLIDSKLVAMAEEEGLLRNVFIIKRPVTWLARAVFRIIQRREISHNLNE
jgi:hypothetical protein